MSPSYEIEIKSLLGGKEKADLLIAGMKEKDKDLVEVGSHKQLNHYFEGGNLKSLFDAVKDLLPEDKKSSLQDLSEKAKDFSVRTRWADGKVILVVKASIDDTTSSNGTARLEWESRLSREAGSQAEPDQASPGGKSSAGDNLELDKLDNLLLGAGFIYQAKWSRERQDYIYHPSGRTVNVSIDKNAGYGYLSEFEVVSHDETKADEIKAFIRETMDELGIQELPQDRLARMFDHYNKNWKQYYGTENIFNIE